MSFCGSYVGMENQVISVVQKSRTTYPCFASVPSPVKNNKFRTYVLGLGGGRKRCVLPGLLYSMEKKLVDQFSEGDEVPSENSF